MVEYLPRGSGSSINSSAPKSMRIKRGLVRLVGWNGTVTMWAPEYHFLTVNSITRNRRERRHRFCDGGACSERMLSVRGQHVHSECLH